MGLTMNHFLINEDSRMLKEFRSAISMLLVVTLATGLLYPLLITGLAQLLLPTAANGSLIRDAGGQVRGSWLLAQSFEGEQWFQSRPSAGNFATLPSAASNLSADNPLLLERVRRETQRLSANATSPVPMALVTTSASGLDPHLPPEAVRFQAARVARVRHLPLERLDSLIEQHTERPLFGPAVVNLLALNQALGNALPLAIPHGRKDD
jgi:potassium-transporting ATPase KdpC subunit